MIKLAKYKDCTGCGACKASCSKGSILFDYDNNGHLKPSIDHDRCIECGLCQKHCPVVNDNKLDWHDPKDYLTFTAWTIDNDVAYHSTSGGVFAQIAIDFISLRNGFVYGVELSNHNTCKHVEIASIGDLGRIVGTKYIQSDASCVYPLIRQHLLHSEPCLFSGTPCQIAGLYVFLQNISTENLFTVELICHGVPSKYITDLACKYYNADHILSYRNKETGWHKGYSCKYVKGDGYIIEDKYNDFFFRRFGIAERPSCYHCKYARIERLADLTIGDQWGLMKKYSERKKYGASLVLCNTQKGKMLIDGSTMLHKEKNELSTLNAPTLFLPVNLFSITNWIWLIKKLPIRYQYAFATLDRRYCVFTIPFIVMYRIKIRLFSLKYSKTIKTIKNSLNW